MSAIVPSVRALSSCSGYGTLIVPQWPSAYFWPFLHDSSSQFKSFVKGVFELPCIEDLLLEGPGQRQIYKARPSVFSGCPRFRMLALRVDFRWAFFILVYHARLFSFSSNPHLVIADLLVYPRCVLPDLAVSFCLVVWPPFVLHLLPDLASSFWPYVFRAKLFLLRVCYFIVFCLIWQYLLGRFDGFCGISFSVCIMYLLFYVILPFVFLLTLILFYFL